MHYQDASTNSKKVVPKCLITKDITDNVPKYIIIKPTSTNSNEEEARKEIIKSPETSQYSKNSLSKNEYLSFSDLSCSYKLQKRSDSKCADYEYSKLYFTTLINYLR